MRLIVTVRDDGGTIVESRSIIFAQERSANAVRSIITAALQAAQQQNHEIDDETDY